MSAFVLGATIATPRKVSADTNALPQVIRDHSRNAAVGMRVDGYPSMLFYMTLDGANTVYDLDMSGYFSRVLGVLVKNIDTNAMVATKFVFNGATNILQVTMTGLLNQKNFVLVLGDIRDDLQL